MLSKKICMDCEYCEGFSIEGILGSEWQCLVPEENGLYEYTVTLNNEPPFYCPFALEHQLETQDAK